MKQLKLEDEHDKEMRKLQDKISLLPMNFPFCLEDLNEIFPDK